MTTNTDDRPPDTDWPSAAGPAAELHVLRARYQVDRDLFSPREVAHLRFMRWLASTMDAGPEGKHDKTVT